MYQVRQYSATQGIIYIIIFRNVSFNSSWTHVFNREFQLRVHTSNYKRRAKEKKLYKAIESKWTCYIKTVIYEAKKFKRKCCKFDSAVWPLANKHPEQVCQIISVNLNLTVRIKVQILERYWSLLVCLICRYIERNIERDLNDSKRFKRHSD